MRLHISDLKALCVHPLRELQMHVITDSMDNYYGPYANKALAERVLKIVQMAADESAEMLSEKVDPFQKKSCPDCFPIL